jgi:hypothetical protein
MDLVKFTGQSMDQWTKDIKNFQFMDDGARIAGGRIAIEERHKELWTDRGSGPDRFLTISFARARFDGIADFSGRSFERAADFTDARFYSPPDFDGASNVARIDFTGAHIGFARPGRFWHWTSETKVPLRLRALRKLAEETKNHDLERDLYIEERKAERGVYWRQGREELRQRWDELKKAPWREWPRNGWRLIAQRNRLTTHILWITVMWLYWALADYGRSFWRPFPLLIASVLFFRWGYAAILAPLMPQASTLDAAKYARAEWMVALGNAVPLVGPLTIDGEIKKFLFCRGFGPCLPIPPDGFQLLVIFQNLVSIILVFFIGLALRNYFRIK